MAEPASPTGLDPDVVDRFIVVVLVVGLVWNLVGNLALPGRWYVPANLAVGAVLVALARRHGLGWRALGLEPGRATRGLAVGLGAAALVAAAIAGALWGFEAAFESDDVRGDSPTDHWYVPLVRIPLGTAVFEELLFRSVLLGVLLARGSTRSAVLTSSVVFGLWHMVPAWETADGTALGVVGAAIGTVLVTTAAGVGFALLRLWSGSVLAPILAHWATNSLAYLAALVALDLL